MNSLDPWRLIVTDAYGDIVAPRPHYGHPFYREIPSWIHYGDRNDTTRQLFDGAFIGADPAVSGLFDEANGKVSGWVDNIGANMTNIIGAELTALSAPYGYGRPFYGPFRPYLGAEAPSSSGPVAAPIVVPGAAGASAKPPQRTGLLAEVAPVVAPATGEIKVKKDFDSDQILHVEICLDGKCYRTSMNLAPAIKLVMDKLAHWHESMHAQQPPPSTVVSTVESAIVAAGDAMADVMIGHHIAVMTGSWLDDIGNAIGSTLRKLGPVISTVATGVATAYGGPAAGAAAAKLAPMITDLQANALDPNGDPKKKAEAAAALQRVKQVAATDPTAAQALAAAQLAVKNTAIAYHVKDRAQRAAAGDRLAQLDVANIIKAAEQGDPAAKSTAPVLTDMLMQELLDRAQHSETGAKFWERLTGRGPATVSSGWYDINVGQW